MKRGNPHKSRYRHGKIEKTVGLDILKKLMERVEKVDRSGYSTEFIQALIAMFYWTGLRRSEVLGDKGQKWKLKSGEVRNGAPFPGLLKDDLSVDDQFLYVRQVARKHGSREAPMAIPLNLPYVNLIVNRCARKLLEENCSQSPTSPSGVSSNASTLSSTLTSLGLTESQNSLETPKLT